MRFRHAILTFGGLLVSGVVAAAPPHTITYTKKSAAPGTTIVVSGVEYTIVRLPLEDFNGTKYAITFPAESDSGVILGENVTTTHNTDPIGANTLVDGFPALVTVSDSRSYSLATDFFSGNNTFEAQGMAIGIARIQVGSMVIDLSAAFFTPDPLSNPLAPPETQVDIGTSYNAVSAAEWWKWTDPVTQVNALDNLIDFVRIVAL
jgi:hypothetical protein